MALTCSFIGAIGTEDVCLNTTQLCYILAGGGRGGGGQSIKQVDYEGFCWDVCFSCNVVDQGMMMWPVAIALSAPCGI